MAALRAFADLTSLDFPGLATFLKIFLVLAKIFWLAAVGKDFLGVVACLVFDAVVTPLAFFAFAFDFGTTLPVPNGTLTISNLINYKQLRRQTFSTRSAVTI